MIFPNYMREYFCQETNLNYLEAFDDPERHFIRLVSAYFFAGKIIIAINEGPYSRQEPNHSY